MAKQVQFRGGTTSEHSNFIGAEREITIDTDKHTVVVHDGSTEGGFPLASVNSDGNVAQAENALKLGGKSLEEIHINIKDISFNIYSQNDNLIELVNSIGHRAYLVISSLNYGTGDSVRSGMWLVLLNNEGTDITNITEIVNYNSDNVTFSVENGKLCVKGKPGNNNWVVIRT